MDGKTLLEDLKLLKVLKESTLKQLCAKLKEMLIDDPNVVELQAPINVVGDIHGQFFDFMNMLSLSGTSEQGQKFVFLGDYVDRGHYSVETVEYLFLMKYMYPDKVTLLRGNHEMRQITMTYGFYNECNLKYGNINGWRYICDVFDYMPVAAVVNQRILCVHGGLSPDLSTLEHIQTLDRFHEVPNTGTYADLLWSDPEESVSGYDCLPVSTIDAYLTARFGRNPRGCGYVFGGDVTSQFCHWNDLSLICRAHQMAFNGFQYFFEEKSCVIVWSVPNYCYREKNLGAFLTLDADLRKRFTQFRYVQEPDPESLQAC